MFGVEFAPTVIFFLSYFIYKNFFFSVLLLIVFSIISISIIWLWQKRLSYLDLYILAITLVFDGGGYVFSSVTMVTLRDTLYYGVFAALLLGGLYFKKLVLKKALYAYCDLTDRGWYLATLRTGIFFFILAGANEFVRNTFNSNIWVFYAASSYVFILIFVLASLPQMRRHSPNHAKTFSFILK